MLGVNVGVAAPVAWFPFSGWKDSIDGDLHANGRTRSSSTPARRSSRRVGERARRPCRARLGPVDEERKRRNYVIAAAVGGFLLPLAAPSER